MALLVVGSVAFDSIETPHGSADMVLGGSASFFSFVSSFFTKPRLVGIVGEDFPEENRRLLESRGIDAAGLVTKQGGKTFYWRGRYHEDMNSRDTLEVQLNVFGEFNPTLPESFRDSSHVFLANAGPDTQLRTLEQVNNPKLVLADTMDLWIEIARPDLLKLLSRIDGLLLNDSEAKLLTGEKNLVKAGHAVRRFGPKFVILKKGEHGAMLFNDEGVFVVPAYPSTDVIDPTGAGDSFAGGVMGYLATQFDVTPGHHDWSALLRRAMAYGTVIASMSVEGFGLDRLKKTTREEIERRLDQYRQMLFF
jgi:sugar/nucleoside kinase (ribokinase family)